MILPSKKVIAVGILTISLLFLIFIFNQQKNKQSENNTATEGLQIQEVLRKTIQTEIAKQSFKIQGDFDPSLDEKMATSSTYEFSKIFFKEYLNAKSEGRVLSEDEINVLITKYVYGKTPGTTTTYSLQNIVVAKTETPDSIRAYGNTVGRIFREETPSSVVSVDNELSSVLRGIYNEDPSQFNTAVTIAQSYQNSLNRLASIEVPTSAVTNHLKLLNTMAQIIQNIKDMASYESDPIKAMRAIQDYTNRAGAFTNAYKALGEYFLTKNIIFSPQEDGHSLQIAI